MTVCDLSLCVPEQNLRSDPGGSHQQRDLCQFPSWAANHPHGLWGRWVHESYTKKCDTQTQHSTPVQFDLSVDSLGTVRVWHCNTYRLENTLNYGMERVWCICGRPGSNSVALGFDDGSIIIKVYWCFLFHPSHRFTKVRTPSELHQVKV